MKKLLFLLCCVFSIGVQAQTDTIYSASEPFIDAYEGFAKWITIDATTGQKAALIGGKNTNDIVNLERGTMKLFTYNSVDKTGTEIFDFDMPTLFASISVIYDNNDVYVVLLGALPHPTTGQRIKIWKAAMDGNANFVELFSDSYAFENNTITDVDIDFLVGGFVGGTGRSNGILRNNGDDTFTRIAGPTEIPGVNSGDYESGFLDDSGKQHIVYVGGISGVSYASVYEIQNDGTIIEVFDLGQGLHSSFPMIQIVDIDGDGLNDISIASLSGVLIYKNLGNVTFQLIDSSVSGLPEIYQGVAKFADMNNDGLLDAVVSGATCCGNPITKIYYQSYTTTSQPPNIGSLLFQTSYQFMIPAFYAPDIAPQIPLILGKCDLDFYDVDDDGNMDVLFSGNWGNGPADLAYPLTLIMTYEETLSVNTFATEGVAIDMYPNPARSRVSFSPDAAQRSLNQIQSIDIFTLSGKKVLSTNKTENIDITGLNPGMYIVRVYTTNGNITEKLVKQ